MTVWSYAQQYMKVAGKQAREIEVLEARAADGWDLVSAVPLAKRARRSAKADVLLIFKRPQWQAEAAPGPHEARPPDNAHKAKHAKGSKKNKNGPDASTTHRADVATARART